MRTTAALLALFATAGLAMTGQDDSQAAARKELEPRPVEIPKDPMSLHKALSLLKGQGNDVIDGRTAKTDVVLQLPAGPTTFWPALDAIGKASGIGFSPYLAENRVALTDTPYRPVRVAYAGLFRIVPHRLAVRRDDEAQTHRCEIAFDIAWEPRFRPFYVDLRGLALDYAPDAAKKELRDEVPGHGAVNVASRGAVELEVSAAAPDRSCPAIASLRGTVWAVGPTRMLSFTFRDLAVLKPGQKPPPQPPAQLVEGVTVSIASIRRQPEALLVKVVIENPRGGPAFDTYQSWLGNNRIVLEKGPSDPKWTLTRASEEHVKGYRAEVTYDFTTSAVQPLPATLDGWTLTYHTPGRIVELSAPFTFKDVPLP
jgi:hypothetical protein